jgi:Putative auto-transporter adhesin, head GIN domain
MKKLMIPFQILCMMTLMACAQSSNVMEYNGKTWEQVDGNGQLVQMNPTVQNFDRIQINGFNVTMDIETGAATSSVSIDIDSNLKDFLRIKEANGQLQFSMDLSGGKYSRWLAGTNIVMHVKTTALNMLDNNGNSTIQINLPKQTTFDLISNGNAKITLVGQVDQLNIQSKGNAKIDATKLMTNNATINSNGNADMQLNAKNVTKNEMNGNNEISNVNDLPKTKVATEEKREVEFVSFQFKNNGLLPYSATVITYRPDETGNGTTGFTLAPYSKKSFRLPVGTKIYLATSEQVDVVMSGAKISEQTPFLQVKKEDDGQVFNLRK